MQHHATAIKKMKKEASTAVFQHPATRRHTAKLRARFLSSRAPYGCRHISWVYPQKSIMRVAKSAILRGEVVPHRGNMRYIYYFREHLVYLGNIMFPMGKRGIINCEVFKGVIIEQTRRNVSPSGPVNYSLKSSFANRTDVLFGLLSDYLRLYRAIVSGIHTIKKSGTEKTA